MQQVILVVGDLLAFLFFGALGRASHELELSLATAIGAAYPFALGWLVMGLILGTFRPERAVRPLEAVKWAWLTWVAAWVVGHFLGQLLSESARNPSACGEGTGRGGPRGLHPRRQHP